jgi:putative membrane protein insertion efficiency factor
MRSRWYSRRAGYPGPYDSGYGYRRNRYPAGNTCMRDACLLEGGCCLGEALTDNCLLLGLLLLPRTLFAVARAPRRAAAGDGPLVGAIRTYQRRISAHRAPCCRFTPSCSHYAAEAITSHGTYRGIMLSARRLLRCRPGGARGYDPVPGSRAPDSPDGSAVR